MSGTLRSCALVASALTALLADPPPAWAAPGEVPPDAVLAPPPTRHPLGLTTDVGAPDGVALGLSVRPWVDWLRFGVSGTYNALSPGLRGGLTVDPIAAFVGPTFTVEMGRAFAGKPFWSSSAPSIGYDYANFQLGLEVGTRSWMRVFLRAGVSRLDVSAGQMALAGGASFAGWLAPSFKLGTSAYF